MADQSRTICPWCDMEIVWDPEFGPEDTCPHCFNELGDYRRLNIPLAEGDDPDEEADVDEDEADEADEDEEFDEDEDLDEADLEDATDLLLYDAAIERQLEEQDEHIQCAACQESMVFVGMRSIRAEEFQPNSTAGANVPLLEPPFRLRMFLCPSCFRTESTLDDEERARWMNRLSQAKPE